MVNWMAYLLVALGSALGGVARFWMTGAVAALTGPRFPWGTLLINILGSFIIGMTAGLTLVPTRLAMHPDARVFIMTGLCGGFTTFSAFSLQTVELLQAGETVAALGYAVGSVVLCVAFCWLGWLAGRS